MALLPIWFLAILLSTHAYAYVDPGTGSIVLQLLFAAVASSYFWFRRALNLVKNILRKLKP
jgi:O-antigen/teichoic acid export membrane protein